MGRKICEMFSQAGYKEVLHPSEVLRHWKRRLIFLIFSFQVTFTVGLICRDCIIREPVNLAREGRDCSKNNL